MTKKREQMMIIIDKDQIWCDWWDEKVAEVLKEISIDISGFNLLDNPYCG